MSYIVFYKTGEIRIDLDWIYYRQYLLMENGIETPEGKQDASQRFSVDIPEGLDDFLMTSVSAACLAKVNLKYLSI